MAVLNHWKVIERGESHETFILCGLPYRPILPYKKERKKNNEQNKLKELVASPLGSSQFSGESNRHGGY